MRGGEQPQRRLGSFNLSHLFSTSEGRLPEANGEARLVFRRSCRKTLGPFCSMRCFSRFAWKDFVKPQVVFDNSQT